MKSLVLAMVFVFGLFLQVHDAEAKRYRAIKSKRAYSYHKPVRPAKRVAPVPARQAEAPKPQVQQPEYQDNSLRNTVVGAATGAVVGAATGAVVSHMLRDGSSAPADAAAPADCDPMVADCSGTQELPQDAAAPQMAQDPVVDPAKQDEGFKFDWVHGLLGLGVVGALIAFLRHKRHTEM